jgi:hypothetical protein
MDLGRFVGTPTAVLANRGMGLWYPCTIDGNFRIAQTAPCSPNRAAAEPADRTSGDQEGHRVAPPPGGAKGPSLWPSTLKRRCPCCTLAAHGHRATSCRSTPGVGGRGGCCWPVTPAGPLAFLGKPVGEVRPSLAPSGTAHRPAGRASQQSMAQAAAPGEASPGPGATAQWRPPNRSTVLGPASAPSARVGRRAEPADLL